MCVGACGGGGNLQRIVKLLLVNIKQYYFCLNAHPFFPGMWSGQKGLNKVQKVMQCHDKKNNKNKWEWSLDVKKCAEMYPSGKGYKANVKALGLKWTTVKAIIPKWRKQPWWTVVKCPRNVRPAKMPPRATQVGGIQTNIYGNIGPTSDEISVHISTIRKAGENRMHGRTANTFRKTPWWTSNLLE